MHMWILLNFVSKYNKILYFETYFEQSNTEKIDVIYWASSKAHPVSVILFSQFVYLG